MDDNRLEKLKKLLEITNEGLTRQEFLDSIKQVINQVLEIETKAIEKVNLALGEFKQDQQNFKDNTQVGISDLENQLITKADKMFKDQQDNLNFIRDKVRRLQNGHDGKDGVNGRDGKDADEKKIINEILNKIKLTEIDKLELEQVKSDINELKQRKHLGGSGGLSKIAMESKFVDDETPTGTINGINKTFILARLPNPSTSVKVFVNGARMRLTEDYTLSNKTITFITAPPTSSIILVDYRK
jgi:hypothetical protein